VEQTPKTRICWLIEKTNSIKIWKPQHNPDERQRYEEPGEGDGRKNQEKTKKKEQKRQTLLLQEP